MDEEKIFGPLTFRQFIYLAAGFGLCYLAYTYLDSKFSVPTIVILAGIFISFILNSPKIVIDENYIKIKKANSKNPEEFKRWIEMKKALIQAQINIRQEKGFIPDPELESMLACLNDATTEN